MDAVRDRVNDRNRQRYADDPNLRARRRAAGFDRRDRGIRYVRSRNEATRAKERARRLLRRLARTADQIAVENEMKRRSARRIRNDEWDRIFERSK